MTTLKQFMEEIEREAQEEGQEALDELEAFKRHYAKTGQFKPINQTIQSCGEDAFPVKAIPYEAKIGNEWSHKEEVCLMDKFFEHQKTLPPSMRSAGALLYCPCRKCNPARL